jgi:hypothetical protein
VADIVFLTHTYFTTSVDLLKEFITMYAQQPALMHFFPLSHALRVPYPLCAALSHCTRRPVSFEKNRKAEGKTWSHRLRLR